MASSRRAGTREQGCAACAVRAVCPAAMAPNEERTAPAYARLRLHRKDVAIASGTRFQHLYAVRSGLLKSLAVLENGRQQVMGLHIPGDVIGFDGTADGRHTSESVVLEDAELCIVRPAAGGAPGVERALHVALARELVRAQGSMMLLGLMCAEERLAAFLLQMRERLAARGMPADDLRLRISREEIGSYLGMTLETVSRTLMRFQRAGLLRASPMRIQIDDAERLRRLVTDG